jgi:hypothetical protein
LDVQCACFLHEKFLNFPSHFDRANTHTGGWHFRSSNAKLIERLQFKLNQLLMLMTTPTMRESVSLTATTLIATQGVPNSIAAFLIPIDLSQVDCQTFNSRKIYGDSPEFRKPW